MDILTQISKLSRRLMLVEAAAVAVIASIASGCNTDFLPDDEGQPMVVVNVVATPDRELTARVTRTWPHSQWPKPDVTLADASVAYTVNGRPCGLMTFNDSTKSFTAPYVPTEGDEIAIEVVSEQYGTAAGYTKVPRKVKIDHWSFTPVEFTDFNGIVDDGTSLSYLRRLDIRYSITFTDPAGEENYYMLTGRPYYEPGGGISTDPMFVRPQDIHSVQRPEYRRAYLHLFLHMLLRAVYPYRGMGQRAHHRPYGPLFNIARLLSVSTVGLQEIWRSQQQS